MSTPASEQEPRRRHEPVWPLAGLALLLVAGVVGIAVLFWPRSNTRGTFSDDAEPDGEDEPTLLIATPEGMDLLADVMEAQMTRVLERRGRHAKELSRKAAEQAAEADARKQTALQCEEQLRRLLLRAPAGADKTALADIAGKLSFGPALTAHERLLALNYPDVFSGMLKLTRSGIVPLRELERRASDEQKTMNEKARQTEKLLDDQLRFLERLATVVFEDKEFDKGLVGLTRAVQAMPDFAEARTLRGTLLCLAHGDYAPAVVDCDTAVRADQKNAAAFLIRGLCNWKRGSRNQAGVDFQAAILLEPRLQRYRELFDPRD